MLIWWGHNLPLLRGIAYFFTMSDLSTRWLEAFQLFP
jgi:hypothetical protein